MTANGVALTAPFAGILAAGGVARTMASYVTGNPLDLATRKFVLFAMTVCMRRPATAGRGLLSRLPLANARGPDALILSRGRKGAVGSRTGIRSRTGRCAFSAPGAP